MRNLSLAGEKNLTKMLKCFDRLSVLANSTKKYQGKSYALSMEVPNKAYEEGDNSSLWANKLVETLFNAGAYPQDLGAEENIWQLVVNGAGVYDSFTEDVGDYDHPAVYGSIFNYEGNFDIIPYETGIVIASGIFYANGDESELNQIEDASIEDIKIFPEAFEQAMAILDIDGLTDEKELI